MLRGRGRGLPDADDRADTGAIPAAQGTQTSLGRDLAERSSAHPGKNGTLLLRSGRDAFVARAVLAQRAERSIDLQYYLYRQDTVGTLLTHHVLEAAERGVRVRMLIDDVYGDKDEDTWVALDAHANIDVRLFNPWVRGRSRALQYLMRRRQLNSRMHSKSFTVDNQVTVVGGRNIADPFFDADPELAFVDRDVVAAGPVVHDVEAVFDRYWNSEHAVPVASLVRQGTEHDLEELRFRSEIARADRSATTYVQAVQDSPLAHALRDGTVDFRWAEATVVDDSPDKQTHDAHWRQERLISQLAPSIVSANTDVVIVSPYFVPGPIATDALCTLARQGVRVRILTNSLASNDVPAVHAGYAKYRKPLLRCGVELYELDEHIRLDKQRLFVWLPALGKSSLHAKTMAFDRETMFVGSFNFDRRSLDINSEIGLLINDAQMAGDSANFFDRIIGDVAFRVTLETDDRGRESLRWTAHQDGTDVTFASEPYAGLGLRAMVAVLRTLPIESQL